MSDRLRYQKFNLKVLRIIVQTIAIIGLHNDSANAYERGITL